MVRMNLFAGKEWRCRCRERMRKGEGGMNGESSLDMYTVSCVK